MANVLHQKVRTIIPSQVVIEGHILVTRSVTVIHRPLGALERWNGQVFVQKGSTKILVHSVEPTFRGTI